MGKTLITLLTLVILLACKKDVVPEPEPPCSSINMTLNDREVFVGTWRWHSTTVREWFDVGPSIYHDYTPITEGFEYYFTLSEDGKFKSYRDGVLEDEFILSSVDYELFGINYNLLQLNIGCTESKFDLGQAISNVTNDSIRTFYCPLNFYDPIARRESNLNFFVRE
jgi:hypothetical protein